MLARHAEPEREALGAAEVDLGAVADHPAPADSVQDTIHFTYDDHQAGTASREAPGQPNRVRAVRTANAKYAIYLDPKGERPTEHEMYDLNRDPDEVSNLVGVTDGRVRAGANAAMLGELEELLRAQMAELGTAPGSTVRF